MARTKRLLEENANSIGEEIREYLENCPHDISTIYQQEDIDQLTWDLAYQDFESAMEDKDDMERDERILNGEDT